MSQHPGRVDVPPQNRRAAAIGLSIVWSFVLLSAGLVAAGQLGPFSGDTALGLTFFGAVVLVPCGLAALPLTAMVLFFRSHQPVEELCWWPVTPGRAGTITFVAEQARYHGLWLWLDLTYRPGGGPHHLVSTVAVTADGQQHDQAQIAICWAYAGDGGAAAAYRRKQRAKHLGMPQAFLELDRYHDADFSGRYRTRALVRRIAGLAPGQQVSLTLTVVPPPAVTEIKAHAVIALPP